MSTCKFFLILLLSLYTHLRFLCYHFFYNYICVYQWQVKWKGPYNPKVCSHNFKVNMIKMIDFKEFKDMLKNKQYLDLLNKEERCTWYSWKQLAFVEIIFKVNVHIQSVFPCYFTIVQMILNIHLTYFLHIAIEIVEAKHDPTKSYKFENPNNFITIRL
jgi:hypothetical protein